MIFAILLFGSSMAAQNRIRTPGGDGAHISHFVARHSKGRVYIAGLASNVNLGGNDRGLTGFIREKSKARKIPLAQATSAEKSRLQYTKLPLIFEPNVGQTNPRVKYVSRGPGYSLFLTKSEMLLALSGPTRAEMGPQLRISGPSSMHGAHDAQVNEILLFDLVGTNPMAEAKGEEEFPGKSNYFMGNDPTRWRRDIPQFAKVHYMRIYAGIDLLFYGHGGKLEYDFVVAPGADPKNIEFRISGTRNIAVDRDGNLEIKLPYENVLLKKPLAFQAAPGKRSFVESRYTLNPDGEVRFAISNYDHSKPLIIDPVLSYSTYWGGSTGGTLGTGIAVDSNGYIYVTGNTASTDFPTTSGSLQSVAPNTFNNSFITKFSPDGQSVIYSTYLGGSQSTTTNGAASFASAIAIDDAGDAYVVGSTTATDFPTLSAFQNSCDECYAGSGTYDAYITKVDPTGSGLLYSSYLGGTGGDFATSVAVDSVGGAYVSGQTRSTNFPTTAGAYDQTCGNDGNCDPSAGGPGQDAFVAKFDMTKSGVSSLVYSTYLGGSGVDVANGIAIDSSQNAYVVGTTSSNDFPITSGAFQKTCVSPQGGCFFSDAFVAKLDPTGSTLLYSTYLGGSTGQEQGQGIAVDSLGEAFVTGWTGSSDFPVTPGSLQTTSPGSPSAFVSKLNTTGSGLGYSTYLGGAGVNEGDAVAIDQAGSAYILGHTGSTGFPLINPVQGQFGGGTYDGFVSQISPDGTRLLFSTYLGGSGNDVGWVRIPTGVTAGIAVRTPGEIADVYVTGGTNSADFPVTAGASQTSLMGTTSAFVTRISGLGPLDSGPWPTVGHDNRRSNQSDLVGPSTPGTPTVLYDGGSPIGLGNNIVVTSDGKILLSTCSTKVIALNASGSNLWTFPLQSTYNESAYGITATSDGAVHVSVNDCPDIPGAQPMHFYSLNADGTLHWSVNQSGMYGSPAIAPDGTIYQGDEFARISAYGPTTGAVRWTTPLCCYGNRSVVLDSDGNLYVATDGGMYGRTSLWSLTPTGAVRWTTGTGNFVSAVVGPGDAIYAISSNGMLFCYHPDGSTCWAGYGTGGTAGENSLAVSSGGTVYAKTSLGLFAVKSDGSPAWAAPFSPGGDASLSPGPIVDSKGNIFVAFGDNVYSLDSTGAVRQGWPVTVPSAGELVIGGSGVLYVASAGQKLYAITSGSGSGGPPPTHMLTVASANPPSGVPITVDLLDNDNLSDGTTQFVRTYNAGITVTLTAPATASGNSFSSWTGCNSTSGSNCTVTMSADRAVTAGYVIVGLASDLSLDSLTIPSGLQPADPTKLILEVGVTNHGPDDAGSVWVDFVWTSQDSVQHELGDPMALGPIPANHTLSQKVFQVTGADIPADSTVSAIVRSSSNDPVLSNNSANFTLNGFYFLDNSQGKTFEVDKDGYSFDNQGSTPDWSLFEETFGPSNVDLIYVDPALGGVTVPDPIALWYFESIYKPSFAGNCYGMAASSLQFYRGSDLFPPSWAPQGTTELSGLLETSFSNSDPMWRNIEKYHGYQSGSPVTGWYATALLLGREDPVNTLRTVESNMAGPNGGGSTPDILNLLGTKTGHSVVPYRIIEKTDASGRTADIDVYDNNGALSTGAVVHVDVERDNFSYSFAGNNYGGTTGLEYVPSDLNDAQPYLPYSAGIDRTTLSILVLTGSATMLNTDGSGRSVGYQNGTLVEQIPGGRLLRALFEPANASTFPEAYVLPAGRYTTTLSGNEYGSATASLFNADSLLTFTSATTTPTTQDTIAFSQDGNSATLGTNTTDEQYSVTLFKELRPSVREYAISNTQMSNGEKITLAVANAEASFEITNQGAAKSFDLTLEQVGAGAGKISFIGFDIGAGETQIFSPADWNNLGSTGIDLEIHNSEGATVAKGALQSPAIVSSGSASFTYGTAGTFVVTASGFPNPVLSEAGVLPTGVSFDASTGTLSGLPQTGTVGTYDITLTAMNGVGTPVTQIFTLTVNPAPLTISADNTTKIFGAALPSFTATYSGFVNGDGPSSLGGTLTCTTTATVTSPVGNYPITCSGKSSPDYNITYAPGTLKILYSTSIGHVILPPIAADGTSVFNQGRTIPAKFSVYDVNGVSIGTPGVVSAFFLTGVRSGTVTSTVQDVVSTNNPDTAFRWDPTDQQWIFNVSTANLTAGDTYMYTISLNDGSTITFQYGLR